LLVEPGWYESERLMLRPARATDAAVVAGWKNDPVVRRMALGPGPEATPETQAADIERSSDSTDEMYVMIVRRGDERRVGYIRVNWMDGEHRFAWLRIVIGEERGKGLGTEALGCLLAGLFPRGLWRADAECYADNEASRRMLERLGFRHEGTRRQAHWDGESYRDVLVWGMLRDESVPGRADGNHQRSSAKVR